MIEERDKASSPNSQPPECYIRSLWQPFTLYILTSNIAMTTSSGAASWCQKCELIDDAHRNKKRKPLGFTSRWKRCQITVGCNRILWRVGTKCSDGPGAWLDFRVAFTCFRLALMCMLGKGRLNCNTRSMWVLCLPNSSTWCCRQDFVANESDWQRLVSTLCISPYPRPP